MFDRKVYFDSVRASVFGGTLSQQQVDGQEAILTAWEVVSPDADIRWLAYMLATAYAETGRMWPIEEYGHGSGHEYGAIDPETGFAPYGRGLVQLTWGDNYKNIGRAIGMEDRLYRNPAYALTNDQYTLPTYIASRIMFRGMHDGIFTGVGLPDFFNEETDDPVNARKIINALDRASEIAGYHQHFLAGLELSYREEPKPGLRPSSA